MDTIRAWAARGLIGWGTFWLPAVGDAADPPPIALAEVYSPELHVGLAGYWVSEKYDGVRAYWDGRQLLTRTGHRIHAPAWFTAGWPPTPLDGELWAGRGRFELTSSIVRRATPDDAAWRHLRYMVFDLPAAPGSFTERLAALHMLIESLSVPWVRAVSHFRVRDAAHLRECLAETVARGGEGLVLRRDDAPYRALRSSDILKLKPRLEAEAKVIAHLPGKGKYDGLLGAVLVERPDGTRFRIGSGFADDHRRNPPPVGSWITYAYDGLTASGIPRFARFVRMAPEAGN